jgi:hypothetical protein
MIIATYSEYGPTDNFCTKIVVGIVDKNSSNIIDMKKWFSDGQDIRLDLDIKNSVFQFIKRYNVYTTVSLGRIIGCPHEEGIDYSLGSECPTCVFCHNKIRF